MKIDLSKIENYKFSVNVSHFRKAKPRGVVVVFPGAGYSHMGPCIYYPSISLYEEGYEILNLEYDFRKECLKDNSVETYTEYYNFLLNGLRQFELSENKVILSKSIGTRIIASGDTSEFRKMIWLTPALKDDFVLDSMLSNSTKSLNVIGNKDPFYEQSRMDQLEKNKLKSIVIAGADHGLDIDTDLDRTIDNLKMIVSSIKDFVSS